jgi:hypothetical protein
MTAEVTREAVSNHSDSGHSWMVPDKRRHSHYGLGGTSLHSQSNRRRQRTSCGPSRISRGTYLAREPSLETEPL